MSVSKGVTARRCTPPVWGRSKQASCEGTLGTYVQQGRAAPFVFSLGVHKGEKGRCREGGDKKATVMLACNPQSVRYKSSLQLVLKRTYLPLVSSSAMVKGW
eukprot:1028522-Pelagomonas_calceolata.AAC.1